mmetsp:Transcript_6472/g.8687  ORF Transcript_6472/g.8687 Transcript_6472/m.8687 type:complete len:177 (-) Transcript_6472:111-641(-)|eukprot:CAMPEP_0185603764 /NCGR_PEP_ID=MMETSP0436-20130131/2776_1 /TAXON_ID=626734 ORGANISM="Favella taraikaensis, Strain Fe Narragansett Bay" /NCGR_SAMPLE_ID=MMETSP0436 /ASSEMBLY_ACC=CAM_ASM_000390 /LENGTH=176 /DNA_ID=CAMNT_0028234401 /DNA_START=850 /DNA_END=1380 /DNA_ORIENTATION=+
MRSSWYRSHRKSLDKFAIARRQLLQEVDLVNIVNNQRLNKFVVRLNTTKRQRRSINYFRRFTIEDCQIEQEKLIVQKEELLFKTPTRVLEAMALEEAEQDKALIIEGCDPESSLADRRILFEMTGRRLHENEFNPDDETEEEFDVDVLLDDLMGFEEPLMAAVNDDGDDSDPLDSF